jgi:hypothetical protein
MLAEDVMPNRLEAMRLFVRRLLRELQRRPHRPGRFRRPRLRAVTR